MNERIHLVLDGELEAESLTPQERMKLAAFTSLTDDLAHAVREARRPDLTGSVMAAIAQEEPVLRSEPSPTTAFRKALLWLWAPKSLAFVFRPAYAAALGLVMLVGAMYLTGPDAPAPVADQGTTAKTVLYVQFRIEAPGASKVELAGSFTNWDSAVTLVESTPGVWSTLVALEPGVHDYAFVIDGNRWIADPTAPTVDDGFGGVNSRLFLTRPGGNV